MRSTQSTPEDAALTAAIGAVTGVTLGAGCVTAAPAAAYKASKLAKVMVQIADKFKLGMNVFADVIKRLDDALHLGGALTSLFPKLAKKGDEAADATTAIAKELVEEAGETGCFVAGTPVWVAAVPESIYDDYQARELDDLLAALCGEDPASCATISTSRTTYPIEEVPLGARITAKHPQRDEYDLSLPLPDEESWRLVRLEVFHANGLTVDIELLRPVEWIEVHALSVGTVLNTSVPELELQAHGIIRAIEPCPPLADGDGELVTGRFVTRNVTTITRVVFADGTELSGTHQHPIWSEDKQDWVKFGELAIGEHVRSQSGPLAVVEVEVLVDPQSVYNIEVFGEHVYEVGDAGILTHNVGQAFDCARYSQLLFEHRAGKMLDGDFDEFRILGELKKQLPDLKIDAPDGFKLGKHGDFPSPRPSGTQSHHGAMSAWMRKHFPGYDPNKAPAILMPTPNHQKTFRVYNKWRAEMRQLMGGTFNWRKISEADMRALSEKMFNAAEVPAQMRTDYWAWFERMKGALSK